MRKVVPEIPGRHPRHAETGHRRDFVKTHGEALVIADRIDVLVGGIGTVPGHEQRDALVQIVNHDRVPFEEHAAHRLRRRVRELVGIAIDVDHRVLRPVGRRLARQIREHRSALEKSIEPFDLLVASVRVHDGVHQDDQILAHAPDHRLIGNGEPVRELQHRLRRAGFIGVQTGVQVVERPRRGDEPFGARVVGGARIRQRGVRRLVLVEITNPHLVGDRDHENVAALLGTPDGEHSHARRGGRQRAQVRLGLGGIDELTGCAGDASEKLPGGRDGRRGRQIGHPGRRKSRLGRRIGDLFHRAGFHRIRVAHRLGKQMCRKAQ